MKQAPAVSLIVAVYNKPRELRLLLQAVARQTWTDFELIVADDGSGPEIASVIAEMRPALPFSVEHVRHEDNGWRKNRILNAAIRSSSGEWLVFIDGDCLPHHRFLEDHARHRSEDAILCGRRAEMSARWSAALTEERVRSGRFERLGLRELWEGVRGRCVRIEEAFRFESPVIRNILHSSVRGVLGSNFSVARQHLFAVNGFDEEYDGPGFGEDSDLQFRLEILGLRCVSLRHLAIQYHMHHPLTAIPRRSVELFERRRADGRLRCRLGLLHEP
ncbi:MAG: glycosyltransferase [Bacteroidia bacterium]|nr:glycosyltransferase [Bacteroidia bacterium]